MKLDITINVEVTLSNLEEADQKERQASADLLAEDLETAVEKALDSWGWSDCPPVSPFTAVAEWKEVADV